MSPWCVWLIQGRSEIESIVCRWISWSAQSLVQLTGRLVEQVKITGTI